jgi:5-methylcytosine-specific restriction enzyme subunit McrC
MAGDRLRTRVEATENRWSQEIVPTLRATGLDQQQAVGLLTNAGERLRQRLGLGDENPIKADGNKAKISGLAGVVRLTPTVEIDLAPKFLGHSYSGWREDFIAISNITGEGRLLTGEPVYARYGASSDLASLIGRMFVDDYWRNHRQPLRVYKQRKWRDWSLDGDIDFDEFIERSPEGVPQTAIILDRDNAFTGVIARAAQLLMAQVRDPGVRHELSSVLTTLPTNPAIPSRLPPLPSRHQRWEPLVELSQQIVEGFDLTLENGPLQGPGFIVRTWQAWERLVYLALRQGLGVNRVTAHELHELGERNGEPFDVNPDVTSAGESGERWLLDAKYKTRFWGGETRVSQGDVYEALAFLDGAEARTIVLAYPAAARPDREPRPCGTCEVFERITVDERAILGVEVEVRGLGRAGGYRAFADAFTWGVAGLFEQASEELTTA